MTLEILGLVVLATAVCVGSGRAEDVGQPESLAVVNGLLDGQIAVVKLSDGSVIKKAKEVEIGTEWTELKARGKAARVPTAEVVRVSLRGGRKTLSGMGIGALGLGLLLGAASGGSCESADFFEPCGSEGALAGAGVGAVLGAGVGALAGSMSSKPGLEVYAGPLDEFLAAHSQNESSLRHALALPWPGTGSPLSTYTGDREQIVGEISQSQPQEVQGL